MVHTVCQYRRTEVSGLIPSPPFLEILCAFWSGTGFQFVCPDGSLAAFVPRAVNKGDNHVCLVNWLKLIEGLKKSGHDIVWTVLGGRDCYTGRHPITESGAEYSAVYSLKGKKLVGGITHLIVKDFT